MIVRVMIAPRFAPRLRKIGLCRQLSHTVDIPFADVYRFGEQTPIIRHLQWTMRADENWAVVGSSSGDMTVLFQILQGRLRIAPYPPAGLFPFLSESEDPYSRVSLVSFSNRRRSGGDFYDYTARYGAVRDDDRITLRQSMFPETIPSGLPKDIQELLNTTQKTPEAHQHDADEVALFEILSDKLGLRPLLELPIVALSNGQTRRARILKAILSKPALLLLDEPLTGLDAQSRPILLDVLHSLHIKRSPRTLLGLRAQDSLPDWVTHLAFVRNGHVVTGHKDEVLPRVLSASKPTVASQQQSPRHEGRVLVDLKNVCVQYSDRVVLDNVNWQIRQGERWHLQGANGSGKTTLLSMITGDHPQSYTQQLSHGSQICLFGKPRNLMPTPHLQSLMGVVSPELFDAFPRRANMTVWDAVGTGFDGNFVPSGPYSVGRGVLQPFDEATRQWRLERMEQIFEDLGPKQWSRTNSWTPELTKRFQKRSFVDLSVGEQRMVLLMRALVARPRLVLLDEVWSGMDTDMVNAARRYLRNGGVGDDQAVVVISHWADEVPWLKEDGVKCFVLESGKGATIVTN